VVVRRSALRCGARDANPLLALLDLQFGDPGSLDELNQVFSFRKSISVTR
jgi:hypothetical protein